MTPPPTAAVFEQIRSHLVQVNAASSAVVLGALLLLAGLAATPSALKAQQPQEDRATAPGACSGPPMPAAPPRAAEGLFPVEHKSAVLCLAWSADGKWVATGTQDGTVRVTES